MSHTPEPWKIKYEFNVFGKNNRLVANCGGTNSNVHAEKVFAENVANAKLVVAAPKLLRALGDAEILLTRLAGGDKVGDRGINSNRIDSVIAACREAIHEANGVE